jgi:hypothetical protein
VVTDAESENSSRMQGLVSILLFTDVAALETSSSYKSYAALPFVLQL